jgi:hypothetical protein
VPGRSREDTAASGQVLWPVSPVCLVSEAVQPAKTVGRLIESPLPALFRRQL